MLDFVHDILGEPETEPEEIIMVDNDLNPARAPVKNVYLASYLARAEIIRENDSRVFRPVDLSERMAENMYEVRDDGVAAYEETAAEVARNVRRLYRENPSMSVDSFVRRTVEEMT